MSAEPTPYVEMTTRAGTMRAAIVHGAVDFGWLAVGARSWSTTRKSLDEAGTFAGALTDLIRNERIRQRGAQNA